MSQELRMMPWLRLCGSAISSAVRDSLRRVALFETANVRVRVNVHVINRLGIDLIF